MYVQDDTDIISFISYALYKQQKSNYVEKLINEGRSYSAINKALKEFDNHSCTPSFIEGNQERAGKLIGVYKANLLNAEAKQLIHNLELKIKAVNDVVAPKPTFFRDVGVNLLSNLIWVFFIALVAFIYNLIASEDFLDFFLNKLIEAIDKQRSSRIISPD